jgi:hypothetical protein
MSELLQQLIGQNEMLSADQEDAIPSHPTQLEGERPWAEWFTATEEQWARLTEATEHDIGPSDRVLLKKKVSRRAFFPSVA